MKSYSQFMEEVSQALSTIEKNYQRKHPGIKLSFSHSPRSNTIRVNNIRIPQEQQGKGKTIKDYERYIECSKEK